MCVDPFSFLIKRSINSVGENISLHFEAESLSTAKKKNDQAVCAQHWKGHFPTLS